MNRRIVKIDPDKCNGCGLCVTACHEAAIALKNGKAVLLRDDYCDGLGDCLPACPAGAISFEEREALPYDEEAVRQNLLAKQASAAGQSPARPGMGIAGLGSRLSELRHWPVQLKLAPVRSPAYVNADLLIAADCTAFSRADFHQAFMKDKITLIGCPKLDDVDYSKKLADILSQNPIRSIQVVRMEVPCCGGLIRMVENAVAASNCGLDINTTILSTEGGII